MKKILIPLAALAMLTLVGCGEPASTSSATSEPVTTSSEPVSTSSATSEPVTTSSEDTVSVAISNRDALGAEWHVGDPDRSVELELTPKVNIAQAIADGTLTIVSDSEAVTVLGRQLHAAAEGQANITVTYSGKTDTIALSVARKLTNKDKYGTVHEGTLEDPFDNTDAVKVGLWCKENGNTSEELYVKGEVDTFYHAPGSRDDGAVSWYLKELVSGEGRFEVYKCFKADGSPLTDKDIWKGAVAVAHGIITYYAGGNQPEFTAAVLDSVEGEPPADPIEITSTVAKAIEDGKKLSDGDSSYDYYVITGYVVKKSGNNFFLSDNKTLGSETDKELFELYNVPEADQAKLTNGAKVTVKTKIKNYHDQIENGAAMEINVVEAGKAWDIAYVDKKVSEALEIAKALADGATSPAYYKVTGIVKEVTEAYSSYGNMSFTIVDKADDTETLTVFRLKMSAAKAAGIVAGNTVVVGGQLQNYVKSETHTYELTNGVLFDVKDASGASVVSYGTKEAPLSVADLLGNDGALCEKENGKFSKEKVTVKAMIISGSYSESYGTWTLTLADSAKGDTIKCTGVKLAETVAKTVAPNDTIILSHYLEFYNNSWSLYYTKTSDVYNYGDILERSKVGTAVIAAAEANEHVTIAGLAGKYNNDEEVTFTVTPDDGYEVVSVELYGKTLTATEGTYKAIVAGDGQIVVTVQEAGAVVKSVSISVASLGQPEQAYTAKVEKTIGGVDIVSANVGNYGDGLQYRVKNGDASNIYNTSATPSAIKSITVTQSSTRNFVADDKEFLTISGGTSSIASPVDDDVVSGADADSGVWTVNFTEAENVTYFSVGHHSKNSGAVYIASIVVDLY